MTMAQNTPSKQLFNLLVTQDFDPELLDSSGKPAQDPSQSEIFSFDFVAKSGKNYGTVVIMLGDDNRVEMFFGDNIGKTMDELASDKDEWYQFMHQIKQFATKNFMEFSSNNINRLRYSMQGQAAIKEGLFESWSGNKTTSYNDKPDHVRLMIKHKKPISAGDARYRYIDSLFLETSDGERFKLPFTKLAGGRAMCEHVRNGGKPYDVRGQHIAGIVEEINVLSRFKRANHGKVFEGDTAQLVTETSLYQENLNKILKGLSTNRGYTNYFESWNPAEITEQDVIIENIKTMFVRQDLDERIEQALPILAKIQKQGHAMKEANIFESWATRLMEGTWNLPDTPEKKDRLVDLLNQEFLVGPDATNATEQLYDLVGDDILFDQLQELADQNADADARQLVLNRLQELADDPDIAEVIQRLNVDVDQPNELSLDQDIEADEAGIEQDVKEGDLGSLAGSVVGGAVGGPVGARIGSVLGSVAGDAISHAIDPDEEVNEDNFGQNLPANQVPGKEKLLKTPVTPTEKALAKIKDFVKGATGGKDIETFGSLKEGTLQGQYGHSGNMEVVISNDPEIMDRIKMLAGITTK